MKIMELVVRYIPRAFICTLGVFLLACSSGKDLIQRTASEEKGDMRHTPASEVPEGVMLRRDEKNGTVTYLKAENLTQLIDDDSTFRKLRKTGQHAAIALAFVAEKHKLFKLSDPQSELSAVSVAEDELGLTHIKFQQRFEGLTVLGAELLVHLNKDNQIYLMQGKYIPTPSGLTVSPGLEKQEAYRVVANDLGWEPRDCPDCDATLVIFPVSTLR